MRELARGLLLQPIFTLLASPALQNLHLVCAAAALTLAMALGSQLFLLLMSRFFLCSCVHAGRGDRLTAESAFTACRDLSVACAAAWTLAGVIGSQLSDEEGVISVEGRDVTVSQYIDGTYGFSKDRVWYSALVLVGFCIAFWFVVAGESHLQPNSSLRACVR